MGTINAGAYCDTSLQWRRWRVLKLVIRCLIVISCVLLAGCRTHLSIVNGTFTNSQKTYKVVLPKEGWSHLMQGFGEDIAMRNSGAGGATFALISHQQKYGNLPLDVLQTHLFIGLKHRRILSKQHVTMSGHRALHTVLIGEINDQKIKISSYVVESNGWIYDLVYWTHPELFDSALGDFTSMVNSFAFINR